MKTLFLGGVAHGRWLNCPPELRIVRIREDQFKPIPAHFLDWKPSMPDVVSTQLYELRHYCYGAYVDRNVRKVYVLQSLYNDEVLRRYSDLIFSQ